MEFKTANWSRKNPLCSPLFEEQRSKRDAFYPLKRKVHAEIDIDGGK